MLRFHSASRFALVAAALWSAAPDARACGGTFCDVGPTVMPVDQTGENILFVIDEGFVEAHVQIQYAGDPAKFAWIVPMPAVPAVNVGSQALFTNLLQATVPTYGFSTQRDQCNSERNLLSGSADESGGTNGAPGSDPGLTVTQKTVGSFQTFTLEGGTTQEIITWLDTNQFQQDPEAPAILDRYVNDGFVFVAIRLIPGANLDEIHPLVFRYAGNEPCVPIELTAIAATEDMGIRAFFLGTERVVPSNYRHVTLNPIQIDWQSFGSNYNTVVTRAADSEGADGHAFVTEYSGLSNVVSRGGLFSTSWDSAIFTGIDPTRVIDELRIQGLVQCDTGFCQYNHPMILPILQQFLPRPAGITEEQFYSCLSCYAADINLTAWNDVGFADALQQQIIDPGRNADDLLTRMPHLTRMFTTISPAEMTEDPLFHPMADLDDVALPTMANQRIYCNGLSVFELPSGERVALDQTGSWPEFSNLPYAATVEQFSPDGQRVLVADNTEAIDKELADHNAELGFGDSGGCGCAVPGRRAPDGALVALALAAAAALVRRRRA